MESSSTSKGVAVKRSESWTEDDEGYPVKIQPLKRKYQSQTDVTNVENPIQKPKKSKYSAWFVTVATNLPMDGDDPNLRPFCKTLAKTLDDLLTDEQEFESILTISKNIKNRTIDSSLSSFCVERGPERGLLHAHGIIQVKHQTNLQLAYKNIREWIFRELNRNLKKEGLPQSPGMYVHCDFLDKYSGSLTDINAVRDYIKKNKKPIDINGENVQHIQARGAKTRKRVPYRPKPQESVEEIDQKLVENLISVQDSESDEEPTRTYDGYPIPTTEEIRKMHEERRKEEEEHNGEISLAKRAKTSGEITSQTLPIPKSLL